MNYYLVVDKGVENGRRYPLAEGAVSIGRSSQNALAMHPTEKSVSGHHAIVYRTQDRFLLQDLQSTNGTFVNEKQVAESAIEVGDIVGFGKTGPRLKLIASEHDDAPSRVAPSVRIGLTGSPTTDDVTEPTRRPTTKPDAVAPASFSSDPFAQGSPTLEIEQKLLEKRMQVDEMKDLMGDSKRLGKILQRGNLGQTQQTFLRATHQAQRSARNRWFIVVGALSLAAVLATGYFAIRSFQYRSILRKGLALESTIDELEQTISDARKDPEANRAQLRTLVGQLEHRNSQLSNVKERLDRSDFGKFYGDPLERTIDDILRRFGETDYHIPPQMTQRVRYHVDVYSGRMKPTIARYLGRRERYFPMISRVLTEKRLPLDLAYISMLESGLNPLALSHAGARGLWQFMPRTGRQYGLRVDKQVDERTDPQKATGAAAEYFKDLIGIFGSRSSVMLAMAAYNAGEGRVMGALRKIEDPMRNRDFWYIYRMGYLAEETNEYIPRVIALMIISENPGEYGFDQTPSGPFPDDNSADDVHFEEVQKLKRLGGGAGRAGEGSPPAVGCGRACLAWAEPRRPLGLNTVDLSFAAQETAW